MAIDSMLKRGMITIQTNAVTGITHTRTGGLKWQVIDPHGPSSDVLVLPLVLADEEWHLRAAQA